MKPSFSIPRPESAQAYLDSALARGAKRASIIKGGVGGDRVLRARNQEFERFSTIRNTLCASLSSVHDAFPSFDELSEFTRQLFEMDLEIGRVRQALGTVNSGVTTIKTLTRDHIERLKTCRTVESVAKMRSAYIGRVSSVMRQVGRALGVLADAREVFRALPSIDDGLFTVAIAGFPNVGKSTLLSKLTTAKPEIKPYAFTTKGLNVGYFEYRYNQMQCIDTPGTLNRDNPNPVERKADITIKYLAHAIVYVFDPTEGGYSLEEQRRLHDLMAKTGKTMLVYVSKTDIADESIVKSLCERHLGAMTDPAEVRKAIIKVFKEEFV